MSWDRAILYAGALVAVLALGGTIWILVDRLGQEKTLAGPGLVAVAADTGGPIALLDQNGRTVTEADFAGHLALVTFGYTNCPDFCPTILQTMAQALDALGPEAEAVDALFVTVDPERDTPAHLAAYVPLFHERLTGLTGSRAQIDAATRAFKVVYALRRDIDPLDYPVDHSTYSYLMDRDWRLRAVFRADATAEEMAAALRRVL